MDCRRKRVYTQVDTDQARANLWYAVKIAVHNDGRLKLGQYGEVKL